MHIELVERAPARVAYLRYTGPLGDMLGRFWRNNVAHWLADNGLIDCPRYGVTLDDPQRTPPELCRYDACVELPPGLSLSDAPETSIRGGRYAVTRFKGTGAEMGVAWGEFQRAFRAGNHVYDDDRLPFEHYPRGAVYDARTGNFACELCLPVAAPLHGG